MRGILLIGLIFFVKSISGQINLNQLKTAASKAKKVVTSADLSEEEVVKGLKEALTIGAINASTRAAYKGGFNNNLLIKIPFPKDAKNMKKTLVNLGMGSQIDKFEYVLNSAAEDASNFAKDIFVNAVRNITIHEAMSILKGDKNDATNYLKNHTSKELYVKFFPVIKQSIQKVNLTKYWSVLASKYNMMPLTKELNTNLEDYVTNQTIKGLFILIAEEEKSIREDPEARVSDILRKVFK